QVDRGAAFIRGVVERAGEESLQQLWDDPRHLPTPAELDAPGLWLERISLPELPGA
ncbi:MAG: zinc-dependent metalloprotease, partial [Acidimicrobiales bacterium]